MKNSIIFISLFLILFSCKRDLNTEIIHPTEENIPENFYAEIDETEFEELLSGRISDLINQQYSLTELNEEAIFGMIMDVEVDSLGRIFILDKSQQKVYVFNKNSEFITTLGRSGKGPSEFVNAHSMAIYKGQFLIINSLYEIEIFDISKTDILHEKSVQFDKTIKSLCTIDSTLFVLHTLDLENQDTAFLITAFSLPDLNILFTFGDPYNDSNPMIRQRMSFGDISCNDFSSTVVFSYDRFPLLHGYSALDGQLNWKSYLDELNATEVTQSTISGNTRIMYSRPESNIVDDILPPVNYMAQYDLLQVHRVIPQEELFEVNLSTLSYLLDTSTGKLKQIEGELPRVFFIDHNFAVSISDDFSEAKLINF